VPGGASSLGKVCGCPGGPNTAPVLPSRSGTKPGDLRSSNIHLLRRGEGRGGCAWLHLGQAPKETLPIFCCVGPGEETPRALCLLRGCAGEGVEEAAALPAPLAHGPPATLSAPARRALPRGRLLLCRPRARQRPTKITCVLSGSLSLARGRAKPNRNVLVR